MRAHIEVRVFGGRVETPKCERRVLLLLRRQRVSLILLMLPRLRRGQIRSLTMLMLLKLCRGRTRAIVKVCGQLGLDALLHAIELGRLGRKRAQQRRRR